MSRKKLLKKPGIYLIADRDTLKGKDIASVVSKSLDAGADIVQLRDKTATNEEFLEAAKKIKSLAKDKGALFIIDDRVDMALALDSDGIHLGQDDTPVETARRILGKKKIIGLSTHSASQIDEATKKDVDYISVGPVYSTPTKPDYAPVGLDLIRTASRKLKIPFVAIGGIDESNIKEVTAAGAKRIAVVRAILSSDSPFEATKNMITQMSFPQNLSP